MLGAITGISGVRTLDEAGTVFSVECAATADPREAIFRAAVENGWVLLELTESKASLEDIFVRLTTRERVTGEAGEEAVAAAEEAS